MIKKIVLENFFSFREATSVELNPGVNVLVGINGSGKSNFLKAIKLLYETIAGGSEKSLEELFIKWNGFEEIANYNQTKSEYIRLTYEFDKDAIHKLFNGKGFKFPSNPVYELTIRPFGNTSYYIHEEFRTVGMQKDKSPFKYFTISNGKGFVYIRDGSGQVKPQAYPAEDNIVSGGQESVIKELSDQDRYYPLYTFKKAIENIAIYDYFDTSPEGNIRKPSPQDTNEKLLPDGKNLTRILQRIKLHHSLEYEKIEKIISEINPGFKDIDFELFQSRIYLHLREKFLAKSVGSLHISDGTLRFLLLLAIFHNPDKGSPICIDEPELGLHPDMIATIANLIKYAANSPAQIILATHDPLLLNAFDLEDLIIFEKDKNNQSIVSFKTEEDFKDWNENFLTGQLWLRGLIGGKRW